MIQSFRDPKVYEKAMEMVEKIYALTKGFPREEQYALTSQMTRACVSVPANIAEGYGKKESTAEFKRFLFMAGGSSNEMQVLIEVSMRLGYTEKAYGNQLIEQYEEIGRMIGGLIKVWK